MKRLPTILAAAAGLLAAAPAPAQQYVGVETFFSSDADETDIARAALDFDFVHIDDEHYHGVSLETARFRPFGGDRVEDQRIYYRFAAGDAWKWKGRVGSDGDTVLGSVSVHNESEYRQEYFIERDILETRQGLDDGLYTTFVGGAFDLPLSERTMLTTVLGLQDFDGDNLRSHYRGNLIHTFAPEHGLSAQLRVRYFHDSVPGEADYFAPGWHAQAIPTLQWRRFVDGWRYAVAVGYGVQRDAGTSWEPARLLEASITSPVDHVWTFRAGFIYTNTPGTNGSGYDYRQVGVSIGRTF